MLIRNLAVSISMLALMILGTVAAFGQDFPTKPVRIIAGSVAGAGSVLGRLVGQGISEHLGQQVVVDSRGSGANLGEILAKSPPDGYTLLVNSNSIWQTPLLERMPYDPVKDLTPVSTVARAPLMLVVHPSLPVTSVKNLIALAKAKPGVLNYTRGGTGGSSHLAAELFKLQAGVNIVGVPYSSGTQEIQDLASGRVEMSFNSILSMKELVDTGRLKALAVTSAQPSPLAPGVPTVAAGGLTGYELILVYAMLAPAKTPDTIIKRLNQEVVQFLNTAEAKQRFLSTGVEAVGSSPDELGTYIKSDMAAMGKLIKDIGIRVE